MIIRLFIVILLAAYFSSCSENKPKKVDKDLYFTSYEVSYHGELGTRFSFSVDTSKVFLAVTRADTLRYGILPDSVFEIINNNAFRLFNDKSIKNEDNGCDDCPEVSILVTFKNDTVRLVQQRIVSDSILYPVIRAIDKFLRTGKSSWKINPYAQQMFETIYPILHLPPPIEPNPGKRKKMHG
jgi:hypothetical protein